MFLVLWKWPPRGHGESSDARHECAHGAGRRDADRVGEHECVRVGLGDARRDLDDPTGVDLALEGAPERDAERHRRAEAVLVRARDDEAGRGDGLLDGRALIALVERLCDAEREAHLVEPRRDESFVATLVERETGAHDSRRSTDGVDDLLGVCHLRDAPRIDEACDLDRRNSRADELPNELGARRDVESLRLVLEAVAGADVIDGHTRRGHGRGHLTRPGPL